MVAEQIIQVLASLSSSSFTLSLCLSVSLSLSLSLSLCSGGRGALFKDGHQIVVEHRHDMPPILADSGLSHDTLSRRRGKKEQKNKSSLFADGMNNESAAFIADLILAVHRIPALKGCNWLATAHLFSAEKMHTAVAIACHHEPFNDKAILKQITFEARKNLPRFPPFLSIPSFSFFLSFFFFRLTVVQQDTSLEKVKIALGQRELAHHLDALSMHRADLHVILLRTSGHCENPGGKKQS
jgi:hypothetical protein